VEIDRLGRNRKHGHARKHGEDWYEKEDGTLREGIADPGSQTANSLKNTRDYYTVQYCFYLMY
jgi:hypothetical protein